MPKPKSAPVVARAVVYSDFDVRVFRGKDAMTAGEMKKILGWKDGTEKEHFLKDREGKFVLLENNMRNRPFDESRCLAWMQEILDGNWKINGENLIVGKTGQCISIQHRGIALVWAVQEWKKNPDKYPHWKTEPVIECSIAFGVEEDEATINTVGVGKEQNETDVLYRSPMFAKIKSPKVRKDVSKVCGHALRLLAHRTGAFAGDAFSAFLPLSTRMEFMHRHMKLVDCAKHIYEENGDGKIAKLISPGIAAGLLYLFSTGRTKPEAYYGAELRNEKCLDFTLWDDACEFWVNFAQSNAKLAPAREAINKLFVTNEHGESLSEPTREERCAIVIKAWECVSHKKAITKDALELDYKTDEDGNRRLDSAKLPLVGGIDKGKPKDADDEQEPPTETEIAQRAAEARNKKRKKAKGTEGEAVFVSEDGGQWEGVIKEVYDGPSGKIAKVAQKGKGKHAGKVFETDLSNCYLDPEVVTAA